MSCCTQRPSLRLGRSALQGLQRAGRRRTRPCARLAAVATREPVWPHPFGYVLFDEGLQLAIGAECSLHRISDNDHDLNWLNRAQC